jgi:tetratricopeptide (TPR) repeat protein
MSASDAAETIRQAATAFNAGRRDEARRLCEAGLKRFPGQPMLSHFLAAVLFATGDTDAARVHVETSLRAAPAHAPARLLAARIARAAGDTTAALAHLDQLPRTAIPVEAGVERARALSQAQRPLEASIAWRAVLQAAPNHAEATARLGRLAWELGNRTEALALLREAVKADCPASTWFDLGLVQQDLADHAGAAAAFREALRRKPDYAEAAVNLGVAMQESGDLDGALKAYGAAYHLKPSTFGAIAMALTSAPQGRLWLDEAALRRALDKSGEILLSG